MNDRHTADSITSDALDQLYDTNQRLNLRAQRLESELASYRRAVRQWEVSDRGTYIPHSSLRVIGQAAGVDILGSVRHLKHFERVEQAEAAITRVRKACDSVQAADQGHTPAVGWVVMRVLEAIDSRLVNGAPVFGPAATQATDEPEQCCVCGGGPVTYHNYREQPFCWPCADCGCNQDVCVRTGINDPAVSQAAAVLREVLNAFTTARRDDGVVAGHFLEGAIHPDDMARWRTALPKEQH